MNKYYCYALAVTTTSFALAGVSFRLGLKASRIAKEVIAR